MNGSGVASEATDEQLMRALAAGSEDALRPLYARHAPAVFGLAAHSLERAAAEEIVQDVFLAVWRNAAQYDAARGPLRPWLFQIAHRRVLNELRRRSRRPRLAADPDGEQVASLPDPDPGPSAAAWSEYRRNAVRGALELLPPAQRQALGLAFFDELTHEQVAEVLQLRLGTAKTRIRAGLAKLRAELVPLLVSLTLVLVAAIAAVLHSRGADEAVLARNGRALDLVTSSDVVPLRLEPPAGVASETHANYRARAGSPTAVLSLSKLPRAERGFVYQAWLRSQGKWLSLGVAAPDASGRARIVAEGPALAAPPEALEVTLEPEGGSTEPSGPPVIAWPRP